MKNSVSGGGVVGGLDAVQPRELLRDGGLPLVRLLPGEDEMIAGEGGLAGENAPTAGDPVEGVDGEGAGAVGGGEEVGVDPEGLARLDLRAPVHPVGPDDLLGRGQPGRGLKIRELDAGNGTQRLQEIETPNGEDPAASADLFLFGREGKRLVLLPLGGVGKSPRFHVETELVAVARVGDRLGALNDLESQVEGVPAEDVPHIIPADDDHLETRLLGDPFQSGRGHLAGGADGEPVARDEEVLAAADPLPEVGHQVPERAGLPAGIEGLQALGDAVVGRRDLVGVNGVPLLSGPRGIPEDEGLAGDDAANRGRRIDAQSLGGDFLQGHPWLQSSGRDGTHRDSPGDGSCQPISILPDAETPP